ncbi:MAG: hypothetical protein ACE5Z5_12705 [Candidatus Bathyarchaeia archaeon]
MCDCYAEPCKVCGRRIPMHLGDFETDRLEIAALCEDCAWPSDVHFPSIPWKHRRYCVWLCPSGKVVIIPLTENAWLNRGHNHPNFQGIKLLECSPDEPARC